jgi:crotonobetaine/carnitine-CoA ligase
MEVSGTKTTADLFQEKVRLHPEKECVVFEDVAGQVTALSYRDFADRVNPLANLLIDAGVLPGQTVSLMVSNSPEFLISWLAINQAGAVMVPVNVFYAADELQYLLNNSDSVAFITEPRFVGLFNEVAGLCPGVRLKISTRDAPELHGFRPLSDILAMESAECRVVRVAPDAASQIVYTSGTTSRPKGVVISHKASLIQGISIAMLFGMLPTDRTCVVLPLFHVNGQYVGFMPTLTVGGTIVLIEQYSATRFWSQVRRHDCTLMSIVPMQLRTMLAQPPSDDDRRHQVRFSFYALLTTDEEWDQFESRFGIKLYEGYGLSETLGICSSNPVVHGTTKRHCIGLPTLGRQMRVVDDRYADLPIGEVGRILVRGGAMFTGYYKNDEASQTCMVDGWFDTGDNGSIDSDGYFHFFDRSKDVIKRSGENIAATEVERVLNEHPKILESAVISVPDPLRDEAIKAFIVLRPGECMNEDEVRTWCASHLAKFKVPSFCVFRESLPHTSIGKIMKYVLKMEERNAVQEKNTPTQ